MDASLGPALAESSVSGVKTVLRGNCRDASLGPALAESGVSGAKTVLRGILRLCNKIC